MTSSYLVLGHAQCAAGVHLGGPFNTFHACCFVCACKQPLLCPSVHFIHAAWSVHTNTHPSVQVYETVSLPRHIDEESKTLDLRHQGIDNIKAVLLPNMIQSVPHCREIRGIDLANNAIGDAGLAELALALTANLLPRLQTLDLSHNQLTKVSVQRLVDSLYPPDVGDQQKLKHLDLSYNAIGCAPNP